MGETKMFILCDFKKYDTNKCGVYIICGTIPK